MKDCQLHILPKITDLFSFATSFQEKLKSPLKLLRFHEDQDGTIKQFRVVGMRFTCGEIKVGKLLCHTDMWQHHLKRK